MSLWLCAETVVEDAPALWSQYTHARSHTHTHAHTHARTLTHTHANTPIQLLQVQKKTHMQPHLTHSTNTLIRILKCTLAHTNPYSSFFSHLLFSIFSSHRQINTVKCTPTPTHPLPTFKHC